MGTLFRMGELLDFAVEREEESYNLYKQLAETIEKDELKELFTQLMHEEMTHKDTYRGMLSAVEGEKTPGVADDDEYGLYLETLIDQQRRLSASPPVTVNNVTDVLDYAIGREKDAVLFYVGLKEFVPKKNRSTVEEIIKEEGRHIVKISRLKSELV